MMKKLFKYISVAILAISLSFTSLALPTSALQDCNNLPGSERESCEENNRKEQENQQKGKININSTCEQFLGMVSWNCGVNITNEETLKSGIWTIAANVAFDIGVLAGYLVLGYVIYGGYLYLFASGDPNKAAAGKKTLTQAFIGLAIVMSANLIMGTIRVVLVGGNLGKCAGGECVTPESLVANLINWFIGIAGLVSAVFLVYGGVCYMTSAGDSNKLTKAKQTILYSLIGLGIVALAIAITAFVTNLINDANQNAFLINQIFIKGGK